MAVCRSFLRAEGSSPSSLAVAQAVGWRGMQCGSGSKILVPLHPVAGPLGMIFREAFWLRACT
eukprot:5844569-Amphidinium_carterae.2